jgi:hypothetical protein
MIGAAFGLWSTPRPMVCSCSPSKINLRLKIHFNSLSKNPGIPNSRRSLHPSFLHRAHGTIHLSSSVFEDGTLLELGLDLVAALATLIVEDLPHVWITRLVAACR